MNSHDRKHPYVGRPPYAFWSRAPGHNGKGVLDPVTDVPFRIHRSEAIVTAGSCFAQHVARNLTKAGFNHLVTERAHPIVPEAVAVEHGYGMYSARYGNIYTARQLLQLLQRAYGIFKPCANEWESPDGSFVVDPFRPQVQPGGFSSVAELEADRHQHLAAVRLAVEEMDVLVFTLGLTEAWSDRRDGAVFPIAPGVAGGTYDPDDVAFSNFDLQATWGDLRAALSLIRDRNPHVRIILTVSPVPLNATYEDRNVWVSTTWSKSVLRLAAEHAAQEFSQCCYFPSYEVITNPHIRARYYARDGRSVLAAGVDHVMQLFLRHFTDAETELPHQMRGIDRHTDEMELLMKVHCDEEAITDH